MDKFVRGYAEGYYGRLLDWQQRHELLDVMQSLSVNTYYYAPKEDPLHRRQWRVPYDENWCSNFRRFCHAAAERNIQVIAGIAPGLDFDFHKNTMPKEFASVLAKAKQLRELGASAISLLLDDINPTPNYRLGGFVSEGDAHADLSNKLSQSLNQAVWVTPRIYANELVSDDPDYLNSFFTSLLTDSPVLYCGGDIVSQIASMEDILEVTDSVAHRLYCWDNLYANDYCPRRLFVGPWAGREDIRDVVLNPTGMVHTDSLLLALMTTAYGQPYDQLGSDRNWRNVLHEHSVPEAFDCIAPFFYWPIFNTAGSTEIEYDQRQVLEAIDFCLWEWKSPLSREWYPYLFGLKHDLLFAANQLADDRISKTQNYPLACHLLATRQIR